MITNFACRVIAVTALLITALSTAAVAQSSPLVFEEEHRLDTCRRGELRVNIHNINFFHDNEYKGGLTDGYTLPGFRICPSVSYQPLKNLKLEVGAYMLHYWGANKYPNFNYSDMPSWKGEQTQSGFHVLPFLRAHLALFDNFQIVLGSIYGANNHHLVEPLFNPEVELSGDPETGLQLLWDCPLMSFDTWVNWESFIFDGDYHQESFTYGLSIRFRANSPLSRWHVYFPLQMLAQHRGGEINTEAVDREVRTWVNGAAGVGVTVDVGDEVLRSLNLEAVGAYYNQQSGTLLPFDDGYGIYGKLSADLWRFNVSAGYWWCKDYITIHGNPLFGAMSISEDGYTLDRPRMLRFHADYSQELAKGFTLGVETDIFNHFACDAYSEELGEVRESNSLSFSFGVYLKIDASFLLKRFK